jgi:hypothetical protein
LQGSFGQIYPQCHVAALLAGLLERTPEAHRQQVKLAFLATLGRSDFLEAFVDLAAAGYHASGQNNVCVS